MADDETGWSLGDYAPAVEARIGRLGSERFAHRLFARDASLWSPDRDTQRGIAASLGWLDAVEAMGPRLADLERFAASVRADGIAGIVHMGMGGSSLAPLVLLRTFPSRSGWPTLRVLDTTDPATIVSIAREAALTRTLFIEASKSGTTAEPVAFAAFFGSRLREELGERAGHHLVAITDSGTKLAAAATAAGYRRVFENLPDIGGRFSALSYFGLVPAALAGIDGEALLARAATMATACRAEPSDNPGVRLGAAIGELAVRGRDKLTFVIPPPIDTLGMWLEQLVAESTGKNGTGILPVVGEELGAPSAYGHDRLFVHIRFSADTDEATDARLAELHRAGHPVLRLELSDRLEIGAEFFRWEIATATAGAILGINPFDQPNVQESKDNTNSLLDVVRRSGALPSQSPALTHGGLDIYSGIPTGTPVEALCNLFAAAAPGDYVALQAYLTEAPEVEQGLQCIRLRIRDKLALATTVGYGPRFLHSTGQYHKGGPNTGLFIQLTADGPEDAEIPGQPYGFATLRQAQALGDLEALRRHGRRALRIHLGPDPRASLQELDALLEECFDAG